MASKQHSLQWLHEAWSCSFSLCFFFFQQLKINYSWWNCLSASLKIYPATEIIRVYFDGLFFLLPVGVRFQLFAVSICNHMQTATMFQINTGINVYKELRHGLLRFCVRLYMWLHIYYLCISLLSRRNRMNIWCENYDIAAGEKCHSFQTKINSSWC